MVALGPALIAGGTSLLSGLLGKGPSEAEQRAAQKETEINRWSWLVEGAQKAGFNPLSVLRASGGQMAPSVQSPLSSRAALGEAIKTFGGTYAQDAIQRATEERAQDDWKERYDYEIANPPPPVPVLSTAPTAAQPQKGKIKIGGDRAADYLVENGPLAGRYVIPVDGIYRLAPQGWVPAGLTEDLFASVASETSGIASTASIRTWPKISVAKDGTVRIPKNLDSDGNIPPLRIDITKSPKFGLP